MSNKKVDNNENRKVHLGRLEHLDGFLQQVTENGTHPFCAVRALRFGEEIFNGFYGVSSPGGPPLTEDAIFPIASITKTFVATLLAILQEDGIIDFRDLVKKYYPEFTGGKKDGVEIWQLLCHSSGMSDEVMGQYVSEFIHENLGIQLPENCPFEEYRFAVLKTREILGLPEADNENAAFDEAEKIIMLKAPLKSDPHTAFDYCSTGIQLMAKLIERLTGESIQEFAIRKLFNPLNMPDTRYFLPEEKLSRVVRRDPSDFGAGWLNTLYNPSYSGGIKSTMRDLSRFGQMFLNEGTLDGVRIISPATVRLMTANHNKGLPDSFWFGRWLGSAWGLGWHVRDGKYDDLGLLRSHRTFDHGGFGGARIFIDPDAHLVVSLYLADKVQFDAYPNHSRVANIIYSALD